MTDPEVKAQEIEDAAFIDEFRRMGARAALEGYEVKHRARLAKASIMVLSEFDRVWNKITGNRYIQPITSVQVVAPPSNGLNDTRRGDPKGNNYRETLPFVQLEWTKIRRKLGRKNDKRWIDFFIIEGTPKHGKKRLLYNNLAVSQLYILLGDKIAKQIIDTAKKEKSGVIDVNVDLSVEGYWEVQFAPQRDQNDTPDVRLSVDNLLLRFQRMIPVIVNGFHLENADNAMRDIIKHEGGTGKFPEGRKVVGKVQKYPYTTLRKSSYEEFMDRLEAGNNAQREHEKRVAESA